MTTTFEIPAWANGPDGSANGGYAAGMIADACGLNGVPSEVSLRLPPPLATPLEVAPSDGAGWSLTGEDGALIATARAASLADFVIPREVFDLTDEQLTAASGGFPYAIEHPFPRCLCCGIARAADVPALNIHCGPVPGTPLHADTWIPTADLADGADASLASRAACFSALDCPSASPFADPQRPSVLARFEVSLDRQARIGEQHVLVAWEIGRDGRKLTSGSALLDSHGELLGRAQALWIEVRRP